MKIKFLILACFAIITFSAKSQTDSVSYWTYGGAGALNFSQVSLTNWAAGGQNSMATNGLVNLFAKYAKNNITWDNTLDLGYGIIKQGEANFIKSDDKVDLSSKFGHKAAERWFYTALFNFKTQMDDGYNYPNDSVVISTLLAPAYILYSLGMDYKPSANFTLFVSPATGKTTLVMDETLSNAGAFGLEAGKKSRTEIGGFLKMAYKREVMTNISFETKIDLFSNYINNPQNVDVNWEALLVMKVNKYIVATLNTVVLYDDDVDILVDEKTGKKGPRVQFKELFGLGLSYKF